jgi:hypothetical protein
MFDRGEREMKKNATMMMNPDVLNRVRRQR